MGSIGPALTVIGYIVLFIIKGWVAGAPQRQQEARDEQIAQGRRDLADGSTDAIGVRIDTAAAGSTVGQHDTGDLLQQFGREEGVVILPDRTGGDGQAA